MTETERPSSLQYRGYEETTKFMQNITLYHSFFIRSLHYKLLLLGVNSCYSFGIPLTI